MSTVYEWAVEPQDADGDIQDVCYWDNLIDAMTCAKTSQPESVVRVDICLMKTQGNDADGELYREYAYPANGILPTEFPDGSVVPRKYQRMWLDMHRDKPASDFFNEQISLCNSAPNTPCTWFD